MTSPNPSLKKLILSGTDEDIIQQYSTLSERSKTRSFGMLEEEVVIVDTETTGLDFNTCELIQIAACRMQGNTITERFNEFIIPKHDIPSFIEDLTGIRNSDVKDARSASEVVKDFKAFVYGSPIVAHNADFDRAFLEREAEDNHVTDLWIDSLSLSRIALPRLKNHKLANLAEAFGAHAVSHQADDDVLALAKVWRIILTALSDMPAGLLEAFSTMHPDVAWSYRPIFSYLAQETPHVSFSLLAARETRVKFDQAQKKEDYAEIRKPQHIDLEALSAEYQQDGLLGKMYEGFEPRAEQIEMSKEVACALNTSTHRAIEAGTGVGKSIAYLLPAVLMANQNQISLGVATKTNALMDQLLSHELPALEEAMGEPLKYYAIKGYDHYACLKKVEYLAHNKNRQDVTEDILNMLAMIYVHACQSSHGDLDEIHLYWKNLPRNEVSTTSSECTKQYCPYYPNKCYVHGLRKRAEQADIILTNHALLLRNLEVDGMILPPIRHWIIDEAHSFESEARKQWALTISELELNGVLDALGSVRSGAIGQLTKIAQNTAGSTVLMATLNKTSAQLSSVSTVASAFFTELKSLQAFNKSYGSYTNQEIWISYDVRTSEIWSSIAEYGKALETQIEKLIMLCIDAEKLAQEADEEGFLEIHPLIQSLQQMHKALMLVLEGSDTNYVFSASIDSRDSVMVESLMAERYDVGSVFSEKLYPEMASLVYTSATIAVGETFEHFLHAVGLDLLERSMYKTVQLDSSYDYQQQMSVITVPSLAQPNSRQYLDDMEEFLYQVHVSMGGSTLSLFTNRKEMEELYKRLKPKLSAEGLQLNCQLKGTSIKQIREQFLEDETSSLFALKSFWEGFDAVGDTLRCVVISKLPFPNPNTPLSKERSNRDRSAWGKYDLPEAVLSVKQAAGRLIRSSSDTGCLIMADSRLAHKSYGKVFMNSLPKKDYSELTLDQLSTYLRMFRKTE